MIDEELRRAAADLREELSQVEPPPFRPKTQLAGRVMLVAATVAVFAIGMAIFVEGIDRDSDPIGEPDPVVIEDRRGDPDLSAPDNPEDDDSGIEATEPEPGPAVTDLIHRPATEMARPAPGRFELEPEFGTVIAAVTSAPAAGMVVPTPEGAPSWNADGSLLALYETGSLTPQHVLYDGGTFERIGELPITPLDIEQLFWDPSSPTRLFFTSGSTVRAFDLDAEGSAAGRETVIATVDGCDELSAFRSQRPISSDSGWMGLICTTADGSDWVIVDLATGAPTRTPALGSMAPLPIADGSRFVVITDDGVASVVDTAFESAGPDFRIETNQLTIVRTEAGRDLLVTTIFDEPQDEIGSVIGYDLADGTAVPAIDQASGYPYPPSGTNISTALGANGLLVASIRGAQDPDDRDTLDGEILLVDFNQPDPTVYRLGHHRSEFEGAAFDGYRSTPWVAIDPSGTRVLFSSHWGGDRVDTFVIDIEELRGS